LNRSNNGDMHKILALESVSVLCIRKFLAINPGCEYPRILSDMTFFIAIGPHFKNRYLIKKKKKVLYYGWSKESSSIFQEKNASGKDILAFES
jgi:hypothetical protein